jgi:hypothetical protein
MMADAMTLFLASQHIDPPASSCSTTRSYRDAQRSGRGDEFRASKNPWQLNWDQRLRGAGRNTKWSWGIWRLWKRRRRRFWQRWQRKDRLHWQWSDWLWAYRRGESSRRSRRWLWRCWQANRRSKDGKRRSHRCAPGHITSNNGLTFLFISLAI